MTRELLDGLDAADLAELATILTAAKRVRERSGRDLRPRVEELRRDITRQGATPRETADGQHADWADNRPGHVSLLLTARQVAERVGVDVRTAQRWISAGDLPSVMVGGRKRVPLEALIDPERWKDSR